MSRRVVQDIVSCVALMSMRSLSRGNSELGTCLTNLGMNLLI